MQAAQGTQFAGAAENPNASYQPTAAETETRQTAAPLPGAPSMTEPAATYSPQGVGGTERPVRLGPDSSGLDFSTDQQGKPVDPQAAFFRQRAEQQAEDARNQSVDEMVRKWEERARARESTGEARFDPARKAYENAADNRFSKRPRDLGPDGTYPVDEWGFVSSNKGGPMRFGTVKEVARWILDHGHRRSIDQIFEPENHPSGKGFAVRERGRRAPPPGGRGAGTFGVPAAPKPQARPASGTQGQPRRVTPLSAIQVTVRAFESDSRKVVSYQTRADKALSEIEQNIQTAKALLQCLKS